MRARSSPRSRRHGRGRGARDGDRAPGARGVLRAEPSRAGESLPGFGHPLYPNGDPRGARLLEVALSLPGRSRGLRTLAAVVDTMDLVARERPTLDVGLVAIALEQRGGGYILRPRARYVGP